MKKLLTIFLLLSLMCVCLFSVSSVAYAEEAELPAETVEITTEEETTAKDLQAVKEQLNALMAKYNAEIETGKNFVKTFILPAIGTGILSTVIGWIFGSKARKNKKEYKAKYNEAAIAYNEQSETVKALKQKNENESGYIEFCQTVLLPKLEKLENENIELKKELKDAKIALLSFADGATIAWSELPDAVKAVIACKLKLKGTENE